jgi:hypothetical protein
MSSLKAKKQPKTAKKRNKIELSSTYLEISIRIIFGGYASNGN